MNLETTVNEFAKFFHYQSTDSIPEYSHVNNSTTGVKVSELLIIDLVILIRNTDSSIMVACISGTDFFVIHFIPTSSQLSI